MPFYMDHPNHGAHVCYTPEDVAAHEQIGWILRDPQPGAAPKPEPIKRKPGRPSRADKDARK